MPTQQPMSGFHTPIRPPHVPLWGFAFACASDETTRSHAKNAPAKEKYLLRKHVFILMFF